MTDKELMEFLHIEREPWRERFIAALAPERRALFERMAQLCMAVEVKRTNNGYFRCDMFGAREIAQRRR